MRRYLIIMLMLVSACGTSVYASMAQTPDPELRALLQEAVSSSDSFEDRFEGEVWLMDMSARLKRTLPNDAKRIELLKHIHYEANRVELPPELVLAVIQVESNFDHWAISSVGARGLMQVMPFWLKELDRPDDDLFHIPTNLRMGCTILKYYYDMEKGDLVRALGRYNGSLGRFKYPNKVFEALRTRWYRQ